MFILKESFLFLLFVSLSETNSPQNNIPTVLVNSNANSSMKTFSNVNSSIVKTDREKTPTIPPDDTIGDDIKNEIFVNDLLDKVEEPTVIDTPEAHQGPHYELNWDFIDKDTIRVTFDLFSIPTSLVEMNKYTESDNRKINLLATMATMPTRSLKSITSLEYFLFIIRPYHKNREIILKMEKLLLKNTTTTQVPHFTNSLKLSSLNHHEKYSVCICYYRTNSSTTATADLLLCQDIINDYSKFGHLRTDPKHGLLFITTQYSIILALLIVLQSAYTIRERRITQIIAQHFATKAHSIRTTLSSVSLVRQSFSSLDAAAEQHATNSHATPRRSMIDEEVGMKKRIISSPAIVISEPSASINNGATNSDETEPFLRRIPSKNHVHFLLGQGEGTDDETENENEDTELNTALIPQTASARREPYGDQTDAVLSMAHILDTNKPWSKHSHETSPV